ncbi:hypothetical protein [Dyadobacter sp. MSC1_007]|jgi:hypothetical protein|uniref:hypothetical protein n=1 Tax=Dyadobacter sp. MSC1_007 TaxID=2909264 RepID=UPI0020305B78|nr:hypothetical protein [Dyadobacter sp. MSC1_007]
MKTMCSVLCFLIFGVVFNGFSQAAPTDFYAGKWEISVPGSPRGDVVFLMDLMRENGKLTGSLVDKADPASGARKIVKVEESAEKLIIYFESSQGDETSMELAKVDNDHLKGSVHNFEATAKRVK